ncbi:MAG: hypothetical protein ACI4VW_01855 [Acutalibacteraceae bacterium]
MKIAEIEAKIENDDCSEETLDLFKSALKRVSKKEILSSACRNNYFLKTQ